MPSLGIFGLESENDFSIYEIEFVFNWVIWAAIIIIFEISTLEFLSLQRLLRT